jgi:3-oxoadipate enol-lactonase
MHKATLDGIELQYDERGSGEPVLLIGPGPIADSFAPLLSERVLTNGYRLVRYRQQGQNGRTPLPAPVSFARHAADAAALLGSLGVRRAHIAGHSTGAAIAMQLAFDHPHLVHTLALLEPPLLGAPSAGAFFEKAQPALRAYAAGDRGGAVAAFLSMVSGLDWGRCRTLLESRVAGATAQAVDHAEIFFDGYLPALQSWEFGRDQAAAIRQPVLSVLGTATEQWFADGHQLLHAWFAQAEDCIVDGVGHLLHLQQPRPVAEGVEAFFSRHPMSSD